MSDVKKSSAFRRSTCYLLNIKQPERTWKRLKLGFQRTSGTVTVLKQDRALEATIGFVDVSENSASFYTPELLNKGAQVELAIEEPFPLRVMGLVSWSVPVYTGIHDGRFKYRSGVQFIFEGEQTRKTVQDFVQKLALDPMESIRSALTVSAMSARVEAEKEQAAAAPGAEPAATGEAAPAAPATAEAAPPAAEGAPAAPAGEGGAEKLPEPELAPDPAASSDENKAA